MKIETASINNILTQSCYFHLELVNPFSNILVHGTVITHWDKDIEHRIGCARGGFAQQHEMLKKIITPKIQSCS